MAFSGTLYSHELDIDANVHIVLPDRADEGTPIKTVYLLHGSSGGGQNWLNTRLHPYANRYGVAFILPEVGNTFYRDIPNRGGYFTYIADELPRTIARFFRLSQRREDVAVMGCSMGGYGALKCALSRPEQYGFCGAFSSGCLGLREYLAGARRGEYGIPPAFYAAFGPNLESREDDEILDLARRTAHSPVKPSIYMAAGTEDFLLEVNRDFVPQMEPLGFDFTYEEWPGEHDWFFWDEALRHALEQWTK